MCDTCKDIVERMCLNQSMYDALLDCSQSLYCLLPDVCDKKKLTRMRHIIDLCDDLAMDLEEENQYLYDNM